MNHRDLAMEFVRRFCAGDVDGLAPLLANDLVLDGPLLRCDSAADYLAALRRDPPRECPFRIIGVTTDDDSVAVFYEYRKPVGPVRVAQLFRFGGGRIREIHLVF